MEDFCIDKRNPSSLASTTVSEDGRTGLVGVQMGLYRLKRIDDLGMKLCRSSCLKLLLFDPIGIAPPLHFRYYFSIVVQLTVR